MVYLAANLPRPLQAWPAGVEVPNVSFTALPLFFYFIRTLTFTILFV